MATCCPAARERMTKLDDEYRKLVTEPAQRMKEFFAGEKTIFTSYTPPPEDRDQIRQIVEEKRWLSEGGCHVHNREEH